MDQVDAFIQRYRDSFPEVAKKPQGLIGTIRSTLLDMGADFGYEVVMSEWEDHTLHAMVIPRPGSNKVQKILLELVGDTWFIDELRRDGMPQDGGFTKTFPKHDRPSPDATFAQLFLNPVRTVFADGVRVARKDGQDIVVEVEGQQPATHTGPRLAVERD